MHDTTPIAAVLSRRTFLKHSLIATSGAVLTGSHAALSAASADTASVVAIGSRRELFVDNHLIERLIGKSQQRLHHPVPREIALVHDAPWEGTSCGYHTSTLR